MPQHSEVNFDRELVESLSGYDRAGLRQLYDDQNCFLVIEDFLPKRILEALLADVARSRQQAHRTRIPGQKKGASVPRHVLAELNCKFGELYSSPALRSFLQELTGESLFECPPEDIHGYTLYCYTEAGDHIGWHHDTSFYRGRRFTLLLGLVENQSCRLECELFRGDRSRESVYQSHALKPGTLVVFDGDRLWHRVTPLSPDDGDRFVLTMEFVTNSSMSPIRRLASKIKDATAYFGWKAVFVDAGRR